METAELPLIAADPAPFVRFSCVPARPVLVVCDHASAAIPDTLGRLGLPDEVFGKHVAWDIGAADVARELALKLSAPAVMGGYSRLVVDLNRNLDDPTAFPEVSDGIAVPGNARLTAEDRQARANSLYWPYHHAVRDELRALEDMAPAPALVAIHSFTPRMNGEEERPWHFGILWDKDDRIAVPLMENLAAEEGIMVGDNLPYSGAHPADFTIDHHAEAEGLPHVGIEIRQDLIETEEGAREWADRLCRALLPILDDENLYVNRAGKL